MHILTTITAIFLAILCVVLSVRIIFAILFNQAQKRYRKFKKIGKKILPQSKKNFPKEDEELLKKLEIPRAHSQVKAEMKEWGNQAQSGSYEIIPSAEKEQELREMNETQIVDFVKPIGFWTSMILGQKLTYLVQSAQILNKRGDKGFWASMIEAKERAAGRQHGRGR